MLPNRVQVPPYETFIFKRVLVQESSIISKNFIFIIIDKCNIGEIYFISLVKLKYTEEVKLLRQ